MSAPRFSIMALFWVVLAGGLAAQTQPPAEPAPPAQTPPPAESPPPPSAEERIRALEERVRELESRPPAPEGGTARSDEAPIIGVGKRGFFLKTKDESFLLRLRGYLQADGHFFVNDDEKSGTNTFDLERVRPVFEGTVFKIFDFKVMPDFGLGKTVLQEAYLDARFLPQLGLEVGKYKVPVGLERLQSARDLLFVERALPTNLVPNRDLGAMLHGELVKEILTYQGGIFNGVADGASGDLDTNDDKDFAGRIFVHPFKRTELKPLEGLGVGISGTYGNQEGAASLPTYKTTGQATFFSYLPAVTANGQHYRVSPQAYYYWGPLGALGEYVISTQEVATAAASRAIRNEAWQATVSYLLTGEKATFLSVEPKNPFDPRSGKWGALELAGRYSTLAIDGDAFPTFASLSGSARRVRAWGGGLNWYLNRNLKMMLDYEWSNFDRGRASGDREEEHVILTRFQISF